MNDSVVCEIREAELRAMLRGNTHLDDIACIAFEALDAVKNYRTELEVLQKRIVGCKQWPGCGCGCHL